MQRLKELAGRMMQLPRRVLAGVSGGADSVALVHLLLAQGCEVSAVHVNHGLRGEASQGDEAFVRSLCEHLHVPLMVFQLQPPHNPSEDWARRERYRCFREAMAQTGAQALVLAHHRDDQAETLLLHLMRGSGLAGLAGMAEDSCAQGMRILRPLLSFSRQELREALKEMNQPWREDESNQDNRYLRNALRNELLPMMERLSPGSGAHLAATAALLQSDNRALESQAEAFLRQYQDGHCLCLAAWERQPEGLQRRILRRWWHQCAGASMEERSLSRPQTEALLALGQERAGSKCNLPGGWHGYRGWTHLHLLQPDKKNMTKVVPEGEIPPDCVVRTRQTGDWLQTGSGRRSLQDFLTDRKIDAPFRDEIPLLCRNDEVLDIAGVWRRETALRWSGKMPWVQATKEDKGD